MITSIELQVISKILTTDDQEVVDTLCSFDESYYSIFKPHIEFILNHRQRYSDVPDVFTFQSEFPDVTLVSVNEPLEYLQVGIKKNKQHIMLLQTFNKLKDLGSEDVTEAWAYLSKQCDAAAQLDDSQPMNIISQAKERSDMIIKFSKQERIPTGFAEIDKLMYGGLSTVEELLVIIARTNTGKSWVCTKMMESAQNNGFPVGYYSPEMQSAFLATRFDTWRGHFQNSQLYRGNYTDDYMNYIKQLSGQSTGAYIIEDKDMADGVSVRRLETFVKKNGIKLLIVDGISYMTDDERSSSDHEKYKHIAGGLFRLSKKYGCAVVLVMQANRETKESKDDKGEPFPTMYNAEGSDHPCRIATQVFALRQIFDKHVLDIKLEKTRMANNENPVLSYSWDVNTGNMQYLPGGASDNDPVNAVITPASGPILTSTVQPDNSGISLDDDEDDGVEF
nr:MAG TPA: DnaB-like replicative helicase [Caudoviricetes sp.]